MPSIASGRPDAALAIPVVAGGHHRKRDRVKESFMRKLNTLGRLGFKRAGRSLAWIGGIGVSEKETDLACSGPTRRNVLRSCLQQEAVIS